MLATKADVAATKTDIARFEPGPTTLGGRVKSGH